MNKHWAIPKHGDNSNNNTHGPENVNTQNNQGNNQSYQPYQHTSNYNSQQPAQQNNYGGNSDGRQNNVAEGNGYQNGYQNSYQNSYQNGGYFQKSKTTFRHKDNPFRFIEKDGSVRRESKTQYYDDVETLLKIQIDDVRYFGARFFQMANTSTNLMRNYDMILQLGVFNSTEYKASIGVIIQPRDAIIISLQINDLIHQRRNFVEFYKHGKVVTSDRMETKTKVGFAIQRKPEGTFVLSVVSYDDRDQIQHRVDIVIDIYHIIEMHILLKQYPTSTINSKFNNAIANESLKRILSRLQDLEDQIGEANAIKADNYDTYSNGIVSQDNMSKMMRSNIGQPEYEEDMSPESEDLFKVTLPFNSDDFDTSSTVSIMYDDNPIKENIDILDKPLDNISSTINSADDARENVPGSAAKKLLMGAFGDEDEDEDNDIVARHPTPIVDEPTIASIEKEPNVTITEETIQPEIVEECTQVENNNVIHTDNQSKTPVEHIVEVIDEVVETIKSIPEEAPIVEEPTSAINSYVAPKLEVIPNIEANSRIDENYSVVDSSEIKPNDMTTKDHNFEVFTTSPLFKYLNEQNALIMHEGAYKLNINNNSDLVNVLFNELTNSLAKVHLNFTNSISPSLIFLILNTSTDTFNHMIHSLNLDVIHGIYKAFMIIFKVNANNVDELIQSGKKLSDAIVKKSLIERVATLLQIHHDANIMYIDTYSKHFKLDKESYGKET